MFRRSILAAAAAVFISACGGGGGGGGGAGGTAGANVPFTTANYDTAGRATAAAMLDTAASASTVDTVADADSAVRIPTDTLGVARFYTDLAAASIASRERPQASESGSGACPYGGSLSYTVNDNGAQGVLDAGDSISATLTNCVAEAGLPAASGSFTMTFNSITMSGGAVSAATVTISMSNFSSQGTSQSGSVTVSFNPAGGSVTYSGLRSTRAGVTNTYNYTATITTTAGVERATFAGTVILGFNNGLYTISSPVALVAGPSHPTSGTLRLADAAGGYIDVTASSASFTIDLYLPGDAAKDGTATYTWADLAAGKI